jgi:hypothetical protein
MRAPELFAKESSRAETDAEVTITERIAIPSRPTPAVPIKNKQRGNKLLGFQRKAGLTACISVMCLEGFSAGVI